MLTNVSPGYRKPLLFRGCSRCLVTLAILFSCAVSWAFDDRLDDIMYQDPGFRKATTHVEFSEGLKPLWQQALAKPESELQRMAADTIAAAHRAGMKGLEDTTDRLLELLQQESLEPTVRRAVINALIALDAKQSAKPLTDGLPTGTLDVARIVEPALARWDYAAAREMWRRRLNDPETERARLQLAIQCLGDVRDADAVSEILRIVKDANAEVPMRLRAARAAAKINHDDVLGVATELTSKNEDQPNASLLAATLLANQDSPAAVKLLKSLVSVESTTVRGAALRRLFEIDPKNVIEFIASAIKSKDVNIRRVGCETLVYQASIESVVLLTPLLDDTNPTLRRHVADSLVQLAEQESLRDAVIHNSSDVILNESWRGIEQSIIVLGTLDYEPVSPRLLELLTHFRPEVRVATAWGLRRIAVKETLAPLLVHAENQKELVVKATFEARYEASLDAQLSQIFQMFGELGYGEAEPLMREFVPKTLLYAGATRPAAVWAVGKLNEGKLDEPLAKQLAVRLADTESMVPEVEEVRRMSAIGIGRMKAESQLPALRKYAPEAPTSPGMGCVWALEKITGEVREVVFDRAVGANNWFLVPRRQSNSGDN